MFARQMVREGGLERALQPGDNLANGVLPVTRNSNTGVTLLATELLSGYIKRTGTAGGGISDTLPTADALVAALANSQSGAFDSLAGLGFEFLFNNTVGQTITMAAPASEGVTISTAASGTSTVATNKVRHFLARFLCAPIRKVQLAADGTNAGTTLTFNSVVAEGTIVPGMAVYGTGVGSGAIVSGLTFGQGGITGVKLSAANTADINDGTITFSPRYELVSLGAMDV